MTKKEVAKRYILFIISLFFSAIGVALTKHGELGVSPISSVANVVSYKIPEISFGTWLIIWNCVLIVGQIIILKKEFKLVQLLQIPLSVIFGLFTDFGMWCVTFIPVENYAVKMILVLAGIVVLGFGISLAVIANVIMNSGEAFVKAISDKLHTNFGRTKICFDTACVVLAVALSLVFFDMKIIGTREGTVISALCAGLVVNFFHKRLKRPLGKIIVDQSSNQEQSSMGRRVSENANDQYTATAYKTEKTHENILLELMKEDVYTIEGEATIVDALKLITEKRISGVPVVSKGQSLIGFISDGDIIRFLSDRCSDFVNVYSFVNIDFDEKMKKLMNMKVKDIAKKKVATVNADDDLEWVCGMLSKHHIKKAPVMKNGEMVGVINISNITKYALKQLES